MMMNKAKTNLKRLAKAAGVSAGVTLALMNSYANGLNRVQPLTRSASLRFAPSTKAAALHG